MNRREFLIQCGTAAVAVPAALLLGGCGGGGGSSSPAPASGFNVISSFDFGHIHSVTILFSDLAAQPAAGVTYQTSAAGSPNHTHTLFISQAQLNDINGGKTDRISTTVDATGHTHEFSIFKPA